MGGHRGMDVGGRHASPGREVRLAPGKAGGGDWKGERVVYREKG